MNNVLGSYRGVKVLSKRENPCFLTVGFSVFSGRAEEQRGVASGKRALGAGKPN